MNKYHLGKVLHESRIALAWGKVAVGVREPWPDFDDAKTLRAYPHNPIAYVDLALAQANAVLGNLLSATHGNPPAKWLDGFLIELNEEDA